MSKKSFLLMRDLLETVDLMTDEEAGKMLKAIINHVDGKPSDLPREIQFAFLPIQKQLDRDMKKYTEYVEKQQLNGAKGGRPKKPNANPENPSLLPKSDANPKNLVTDTVTDTVTVTDTDKQKPIAPAKPQEPVTSDNENLIFDFWKTTMNHPRAKLDKKRKAVIKAALKTGYTVDECKMAILGCSKTPHNIGENDRNQVYDGLHIILKDADNIDRFIGNHEKPPKQQSTGPTYKPLGDGNGYEQRDTRSRAQKVSDKLDQIAREDIEQNGFAGSLG